MIVISIKIIVIGRTHGVALHLFNGTATGIPRPVEKQVQTATTAQETVSFLVLTFAMC